MYITYILRSLKNSKITYVGYTKNLTNRLKQHNDPNYQSYTKKFFPWGIETYIVFKNQKIAKQFEKYLKTCSGKAFMNKHLI